MSFNIIQTSLTNLQSFLQDHQASFTTGLLILFTVSGEQIFKESTFNCPCKHTHRERMKYVLTFLIVPAFVLFLMGVAVSNLTWRLFHGYKGRGAVKKELANENTCKHFSMVLARSSVVPLAWLFVTFLDGNYYACMQSDEPCNKTTENYQYYKSESQFYSWVGLAVLTSLAFIVICYVRCTDSVTSMQDKYIRSYRDEEQQQFDNVIQDRVKKLAQTNVQTFMKEEQSKEQWDLISKIPEKDLEEKGGAKVTYLSSLNKWASGCKQQIDSETNMDKQAAKQETDMDKQAAQQETP